MLPRILAAAVLLIGVVRSESVGAQSSPQPASGGASIVGSKWLAEDIRGGGVLDNLQSTISIAAVGQVTGMAGCNTLRGSAEIAGQSLKFSPLATTRKLCPPAVMDQERKFLAALEATRAFRFDGSFLKFFDGAGSEIIRFSRAQ